MRYVPVTATSSFQPIRSNSPNAVYSFHPVQGSFSCPPVLSGHDLRGELEVPMATGRAATSQKTQKATTTTPRNLNNQKKCRLEQRRNRRTSTSVGTKV